MAKKEIRINAAEILSVPGQERVDLTTEIMSVRAAVYEARSHLGAIMIQTQPQDDQIIIGHVVAALHILDKLMDG